MAQDFAKKRKSGAAAKRPGARNKTSRKASEAGKSSGGGWRWYSAGVLTGVFLSFLVYLGTLPPTGGPPAGPTLAGEPTQARQVEEQPPKPRFDFYKMLPRQTIDVEVEPEATRADKASAADSTSQYYLLQAGSFRQLEDAERRRAELLLLGLEPKVEETTGDNGRWHRVYVGPFETRSKMAKARSLTAGQGIDTLLLKRSRPG